MGASRVCKTTLTFNALFLRGGPMGLLRKDSRPETPAEIRNRLKITACDVRSILANKMMFGSYINDNGIHVVVATEPTATFNGSKRAEIHYSAPINRRYRKDPTIKGRGGGGALNYVHVSARYASVSKQLANVKKALECCQTAIYPDYAYGQSLLVTGLYRPPDSVHPAYEEPPKETPADNKKGNVATTNAGYSKINSWRSGYEK